MLQIMFYVEKNVILIQQNSVYIKSCNLILFRNACTVQPINLPIDSYSRKEKHPNSYNVWMGKTQQNPDFCSYNFLVDLQQYDSATLYKILFLTLYLMANFILKQHSDLQSSSGPWLHKASLFASLHSDTQLMWPLQRKTKGKINEVINAKQTMLRAGDAIQNLGNWGSTNV